MCANVYFTARSPKVVASAQHTIFVFNTTTIHPFLSWLHGWLGGNIYAEHIGEMKSFAKFDEPSIGNSREVGPHAVNYGCLFVFFCH